MEKNNVNIKLVVAIIGFVGTILAALIGRGVIDVFPQRTLEISANPYYSGVSVRSGDLNSFDGSKPVVGFGDTQDNKQVRSFLSFYLGNIPANAKLVDAKLVFSCDLYGNPNTMGRIWIKEYAFWPYTQSDYFSVEEADDWMVSWPNAEPLMNPCLKKHSFVVSTNSLLSAVQRNVKDRYFQTGIYFEESLVIPNGRQDAFVFTDMPVLIVKYEIP